LRLSEHDSRTCRSRQHRDRVICIGSRESSAPLWNPRHQACGRPDPVCRDGAASSARLIHLNQPTTGMPLPGCPVPLIAKASRRRVFLEVSWVRCSLLAEVGRLARPDASSWPLPHGLDASTEELRNFVAAGSQREVLGREECRRCRPFRSAAADRPHRRASFHRALHTAQRPCRRLDAVALLPRARAAGVAGLRRRRAADG